jgi:hypothetical protein
MITTIQILLIVVVVILTVLLTLIGVQIYQVLLEFKKASRLLNQILDNTVQVSHTFSQSVINLSALLSGLGAVFKRPKSQNGRKK